MNPVNENIDSRILRLLGLEDVFDLDYSTYASLLKEALVKYGAIGKSKIPSEEVQLLLTEFKRVRTKQGRFSPKAKKVKVSNVTNLGNMKRLPGSGGALAKRGDSKKEKKDKEEEKEHSRTRNKVSDVFTNIKKSLGKINNTIKNQLLLDRRRFDFNRKRAENERRRNRENKLESTQQQESILKNSKKVFAPFSSFFDAISNFIVMTLLGRAVKLLFDFVENPENKARMETLGKFLKDWWPSLLSAWFLFATPVGGIVRTIVGTIVKWTFALLRQIPKLLRFIKAHPFAFAATAVLAGTAISAYFANQEGSAVVKDPDDPKKSQMDEINQFGGMVGDPFGGLFSNGGLIGMAGGGNIFSGLVGRNSGTTVSGAGPDTQFFPIVGGGGAVLQRGESVLQVGAREKIIKEKGFDPLSYNTGPNANKPKKLPSAAKLFGMNMGGVVGQQNISKMPRPDSMVRPGSSTMRIVVHSADHTRELINQSNKNYKKLLKKFKPKDYLENIPIRPEDKNYKKPVDFNETVVKSNDQNMGPLGPKGIVTSSTGLNVRDTGTDTQYIPPARVQIGEAVRVFTKDSVDKGILPIIDHLESALDPVGSKSSRRISNSRKSLYIPTPPIRGTSRRSSPITLPPINNSSIVDATPNTSDGVPHVDITPGNSIGMRESNARLYGLVV